jgi:hypothetical protein
MEIAFLGTKKLFELFSRNTTNKSGKYIQRNHESSKELTELKNLIFEIRKDFEHEIFHIKTKMKEITELRDFVFEIRKNLKQDNFQMKTEIKELFQKVFFERTQDENEKMSITSINSDSTQN